MERQIESSVSPPSDLARQITTAFVTGAFVSPNRNVPKGSGWGALPEVLGAKRLRESGASDLDIRLFCTFTTALDRARDAGRLWSNSADLFSNKRWIFEPEAIAKISLDELKGALQSSGVSQRHRPDTCAWLAIAKSLSTKNRAPLVHRAIYEGIGNAKSLLEAVSATGPEGPLFPFLRGPKISLVWVRMLANPGGAMIADLQFVPIAVDVQVRKVTEYLGLTNTRGQPIGRIRKTIQNAWQRNIESGGAIGPPDGPSALDNTAAAVDPAVWFVGNWGCTYCERHARQKFPIAEFCRSCSLGPR